MTAYLRVLGGLLLIGGLITCALACNAVLNDRAYYTAAFGLERHPGNILYLAEYNTAAAQHVAYIVSAVVSGVGGVIGSAVLFGLASVLRRLDRTHPTHVA